MKINYRPEIDGLRAIAVLSVVLFHSNIKPFDIDFFSGGYLGVDIFFVISGYLITSIILNELTKKKKFNFFNFYERRARRILPALFFIIIISIPFAYYILLPQFLLEYSESLISSIFFFSNFYFIASDYYDFESILKPLLHTWSLSVEEQFYILYPFFLVLIFQKFKKYILYIFLLCMVTSILSSQVLSAIDPSKNFYLLSSRIWELFSGSILSIINFKYKNSSNNYFKGSNTYTIIGLFLIIFSIVVFDNNTIHPSINTLVPILGVCLIIYFSSENNIITKFLSNKILVNIGLISYSFYLWHFVIFSLSKHALLYHDKVSKKLIILTIILSIISYFLIERPFRNKEVISRNIFFTYIALCLALIITASTYIKNNYYRNNISLERLDEYIFREKPLKQFQNDKECFGSREFCIYNTIKTNKYVFVVGDSILEGLVPDLANRLKDYGFNLISMNNSLCHFIPEFNSVVGNRQRIVKSQQCDHIYQNLRLDEILSKPNSVIILGGLIPFENFKHSKDSKVSFEQNYKKFVNQLLLKNYKIIQITDVLSYKKNIKELLQKKLIKKNFFNNSNKINFDFYISIDENEFIKKNQRRYELFDTINNKNYFKVSNRKIFCNTYLDKKCVFNNSKNLFIHDNHHYTNYGAKLINEEILEIIKDN